MSPHSRRLAQGVGIVKRRQHRPSRLTVEGRKHARGRIPAPLSVFIALGVIGLVMLLLLFLSGSRHPPALSPTWPTPVHESSTSPSTDSGIPIQADNDPELALGARGRREASPSSQVRPSGVLNTGGPEKGTPAALVGMVLDACDGHALAGAQLVYSDPPHQCTFVTDKDGRFQSPYEYSVGSLSVLVNGRLLELSVRSITHTSPPVLTLSAGPQLVVTIPEGEITRDNARDWLGMIVTSPTGNAFASVLSVQLDGSILTDARIRSPSVSPSWALLPDALSRLTLTCTHLEPTSGESRRPFCVLRNSTDGSLLISPLDGLCGEQHVTEWRESHPCGALAIEITPGGGRPTPNAYIVTCVRRQLGTDRILERRECTVAVQGKRTITGLTPGQWTVYAWTSGRAVLKSTIELEAHQVSAVELEELSHGKTDGVHFVDSDGALDGDSLDLAVAEIAGLGSGGWGWMTGPSRCTATDHSGCFRLHDSPSGPLHVTTVGRGRASTFAPEVFDCDRCDEVDFRGRTPSPGPLIARDLTMKVIDQATGEPLPGAFMRLGPTGTYWGVIPGDDSGNIRVRYSDHMKGYVCAAGHVSSALSLDNVTNALVSLTRGTDVTLYFRARPKTLNGYPPSLQRTMESTTTFEHALCAPSLESICTLDDELQPRIIATSGEMCVPLGGTDTVLSDMAMSSIARDCRILERASRTIMVWWSPLWE